jgi:uncharacterized membrane protein YsdA (DUF1294 family)
MAKNPIILLKVLRDLNSKAISRDKMKNHKWRVFEKKLHKVTITGDTQASGRASEVKLLYNDFEVHKGKSIRLRFKRGLQL